MVASTPTHRPLVLSSSPSRSAALSAGAPAPRIDFIEIARLLDAEISYPPPSDSMLAHLEERIVRLSLRQAWHARRAHPSLFLSLTETVGLPVALLARTGPPHAMLVHGLTSPRRSQLVRRTPLLKRVDRVIVLCRAQARFLLDEVGLPEDRVRFVYDKVDHRFFAPGDTEDGGYIVSVGFEQRDYETLVEAVRPTGIPLVLLPSSSWAGDSRDRLGNLPAHVEVRGGLSYEELRRLYDSASLVVVPLNPAVDWAAGVNAVLEGMAMGKPVIVSDTPGIRDYVEDGQTGRFVPARDPSALREVIVELMSDRATAARLGRRARELVENGRNLDTYVATIAGIGSELLARR